ncbi:MAG: flagellar biosynthetic protein FliO [Clostridiales bacterium]|nr:flagellar biosynthetic protein FliO [Clostridiales bacterium]
MLNLWDYIQAIVIIGAVILAAYYVTKLVAKSGGGGFRKSTGIKLIASHPLGRDKSVAIVEIGEFDYILGVSAQRVELLDKLPKSELSLKKEETGGTPPSFGVSFREELNKRFNRPNKND